MKKIFVTTLILSSLLVSKTISAQTKKVVTTTTHTTTTKTVTPAPKPVVRTTTTPVKTTPTPVKTTTTPAKTTTTQVETKAPQKVVSDRETSGKAFVKGGKYLSLSLGASDFYHLGNSTDYWIGNYYAPITGQLNLNMEFGIHPYVGLGFNTGVGGKAGGYSVLSYGPAEINVPLGMFANFHFWQLIDDKNHRNLHSDKLDLYAGASLGSGIAFYPDYSGSSAFAPLIYGGLHAGVRYYFTPKIGINGEVGFGKSLIQGGIVFKL